jgi:putative PEP-CTERM system TPR-repeat lipoprotein
MKRVVFFCLFLCLLLLLACREQSKEQILQQGIEFVNAGNRQAAITLFKNALEKDPNYLDARLQLGLAYFHLDKLDFAEKELDKALRQDPANRDISLHLAQIYQKTNRLEKALSELSRLEIDLPNNVVVLVALGECYALKEDQTASEQKFRQALTLQPNNLDARLGLIQVLFSTNRAESGSRMLQETIADHPTKSAPYYLQYRLALQTADHDTAIASLQRIRGIDANDLTAAYLLGLHLVDGGDVNAARQVASELKTGNPEHPAALRIEGLADYIQGNYEKALLALQKSLTSMQDVGGYYFVGLTHYQLKQYEQALSNFQKTLDYAPNNEAARLMLAQTLFAQQRMDDSVRTAQAILAKNPRSAAAHNLLGSIYLQQKKYDQAMVHLDKAVEIQPNLPQAHVRKGLFNIVTGKVRAGEVDLQNAVAVAPELLNSRLLLASHYLRVQNYPMALKTLQTGINTSPDSAILYNLMAAAYFAQKKDGEAVDCLSKAKSIKPEYLAPYHNLAGYYVSRHNYPAAVKEYQQALQSVPNNLPTLVKLANLYEITGDQAQAEVNYQKASATGEPGGFLVYARYLDRSGQKDKSLNLLKAGQAAHPDHLDLIRALGSNLESRGQFGEAIKLYLLLEKNSPQVSLSLLLNAHLKNGDLAAANQLANRVVSEQPAAEFGYLMQFFIHEYRKDWAAAEDSLIRGIASCREHSALKMKLAGVYNGKGDSQRALQIYDEILLKHPEHVDATFAKAATFDRQGNKLKAQELYRSVLAIDADYTPALNNLAFLYLSERGDNQEALRLASQAFRNQPEDPAIMDTLGYALLKNGQPGKSLVLLEKAAQLRPQDATIQDHLLQARQGAAKKSS